MGVFAEGTPTVQIELGGKTYELGFTMGAMKRAKALGVLTTNIEDETAMMLALPEYVWACLSEEDRGSLTVKQIDELVNPRNVASIADKIGELFKASVPEPDPNVQPAAVKEKELTVGRSTSTSFGQLVSTT